MLGLGAGGYTDMPNIPGTNGDDSVEVVNDVGTQNGTLIGAPIDDVRGGGGNDTIVISNSTIANVVRGGRDLDDITVTDSTISGVLNSGRDSDTISVDGSSLSNIRLGSGDDTLNFVDSTVTGDVRGGTGTDALNLQVGTVVNDATFGTFTVTLGGTYRLSSGTFTLPGGTTITYTTFENGTGIPCFVGGALLETPLGNVRVEHLRVGDYVQTQAHGSKRIRWIGSRTFSSAVIKANPKLCPVRIIAGALGRGLPERDLLVSRQHRMLVRSKIAGRMFGRPDVLVSAFQLTNLPGIYIDTSAGNVTYFHLLFDQHEIVFAEGAPTESLFIGPEALNALSPEAKEEILTIFPELAELDYSPKPACYIPPRKQQTQLIARHLKNEKSLIVIETNAE